MVGFSGASEPDLADEGLQRRVQPLANSETLVVAEAASERLIRLFRSTDHWLARYDHNHLRISRIIQSLRLLVCPEAARRFYEAVLERHEGAGAPVNPQSLRYWREAVSEP